jgi:hypothetical protein
LVGWLLLLLGHVVVVVLDVVVDVDVDAVGWLLLIEWSMGAVLACFG